MYYLLNECTVVKQTSIFQMRPFSLLLFLFDGLILITKMFKSSASFAYVLSSTVHSATLAQEGDNIEVNMIKPWWLTDTDLKHVPCVFFHLIFDISP